MSDPQAGIVLLHSPLTTAAAWGAVPHQLRESGHEVHVPDVAADDRPPYAARYAAEVTRQLAAAADAPVVLAGHSGAGPLLPLVGQARRTVAAYVFVDAGLPATTARTRLELLREESPEHAAALEQLLAAGGRFPDYGGTLDDPGLGATLRPRGRDFFDDALAPSAGWPDAPCGYLRLSEAYGHCARLAARRGWPVLHRDLGHFAAWTDPDRLAAALRELLEALSG